MNQTIKKLMRWLAITFVSLAALILIIFFTFPLPGQIPVLMYHFIGSKQDAAASGNFVTLGTFESQMRFLKKFGFNVISMSALDEILAGKRKPRGREIVLTFDDGNASVFNDAWPILKKYNFPSTQFLISEGLKVGTLGSVAFKDIQSLQDEPLLTWGAHSRTHPFFSQLSDAGLASEIVSSKSELENQFKVPIQYFAYPFGDFDRRALPLIEKAGFHLAFTTSPKKLNGVRRDRYSLTRVKISENSGNLIIFWFKLTGVYESFKLWRERRVNPLRD